MGLLTFLRQKMTQKKQQIDPFGVVIKKKMSLIVSDQ